MTEAELKELCALWQKRLRLQDWNVRLVVKDAEDIEDAFAQIRPQLDSKKAVMHVRRPGDVSTLDMQLGYDVEEYVVHELLHLHAEAFVPEDHDSHEYQAIEQAVGVLADCIVRLSRENKAGEFAEQFIQDHPETFTKLADS